MRLVTFTHQGSTRVGAADGDAVVDFATAAPTLPRDMIGFLAAGASALDAAHGAIASKRGRLPLADVGLQAPVPRPGKFLAIGLNYADHVAESGMERPPVPVFFNKQATCVVGPSADVHLPRVSPLLDYEGELAFVIGRRCRHVPRDRAAEVIAGYTVVNDVSVRDWQLRTPTMTMGKSFDTHGPMGPWLVTPDEVGDSHALELRTWVNGELRQHSNTKQLIFDCFEQVEHLSTAFTLEPGDVITTGTPAGVGGAMKPPRFLVAGDVVRIEIERIGVLENRIVPEPENSALL
jgi:2-keto-4-pentenoate hydratase/2-oxohepta-3-ene-1,7-dioic acid hydratase in catechol pathway